MKLSKFSLLGAFMLLAGCSDDLDFHPAKTGENIQFGTKAYFANADTKSSRTEYGDVSADKKAIELKWVKGDKILIACPQVSQPVSGAVEYQVNEQHTIIHRKGCSHFAFAYLDAWTSVGRCDKGSQFLRYLPFSKRCEQV